MAKITLVKILGETHTRAILGHEGKLRLECIDVAGELYLCSDYDECIRMRYWNSVNGNEYECVNCRKTSKTEFPLCSCLKSS